MLFEVLNILADKLNKENVTWGIGASVMLHHYGLVAMPNDIDILVEEKDIEKVDSIIKEMGEKKPLNPMKTYSTKYFYEYEVQGVDIDVMAGFIINHEEGNYEYTFHKDSLIFERLNHTNNDPSGEHSLDNITLPFTTLEDWYVLYQLIPGREKKVQLIEDYLKERVSNKMNIKEIVSNNVCIKEIYAINVNILKRSLNQKLPYMVEKRIKDFITIILKK